jgi:hypothetical protein
MRYLLPVVFFIASASLFAQDSIPPTLQADSTRAGKVKTRLPPRVKKEDSVGISIRDYKIISYQRDTTFLDTTLTIHKEYNYNYLRKDNFELMPFANVGQPYNRLGVDFDRINPYPALGAETKHFNYLAVEDITYYNVPTPMTELFFKTTFEQGQLLDALLTFNMSPRLNFSLAYKGFRSLGKYQFSQAESGNFRTSANYSTADARYRLRAHIAAQDIITEENGGLLEKELQFESEDPEFIDRSRLDVVFTNAEGKLLGKRYFLDHEYTVAGKVSETKGRVPASLALGHHFSYETKYYQFMQGAQNDFFGDVFLSPVNDKASLKTMYNRYHARFSNRILGTLTAFSSIYHYRYFFNSLLITEDGQISDQLKGEEIAMGAEYSKKIGGFDVEGDLSYTVAGDLTDYVLNGRAGYRINDNHRFWAVLHSSSRMPDFNFLLYQSEYTNYNWENTDTFAPQKVNSLQFGLESSLLGDISVKYSTLDNYTYYRSTANEEQVEARQENAFVRPFQEGSSINHLKVKYHKEFRLGKWAMDNTLMYQNVSQSSPVLNVPELVTRNSIYFSSDIFKKAMFLQTGITFTYFTGYNMDAYNPLLSEFYVQNREELGGFPMLDFFINAKVRQTRIYLKAEHFNSSFTGNTFYSAPNYPYRDFVIRFGLVWNFFS